jgi:hypothetical protein
MSRTHHIITFSNRGLLTLEGPSCEDDTERGILLSLLSFITISALFKNISAGDREIQTKSSDLVACTTILSCHFTRGYFLDIGRYFRSG